MFSHYATRKISPTCKISTFFEDLSFLNPRSHLKILKILGLTHTIEQYQKYGRRKLKPRI